MMSKICTCCNTLKSLSDFHKKSQNNDGLEYQCKVCTNSKIRQRRKKNSNMATKAYEKTLKGKLVRTYRNMLSRVKGILKNKSHLYKGLDILDKEDFYEWSLNDPDYNRIFNEWEKAGYPLSLSPSIDRKETDVGYIMGNIRWLTHSENSRLSKNNKR